MATGQAKRLEHDAAKMDAVVRALRSGVRRPRPPHLLARAIDGLEGEVAAVRNELKRLVRRSDRG